jgi:glycosyltransferase involved in cell wall biosynthesis
VPDLTFAIPGDLETRTGGYIYDRRLMLELQRLGWSVEHLPLCAGFPFPDASELAAAARSLAALPDGNLTMIDGLAFGAMPALAEAEGQRLRLVGLVHHPLAYETGLTPDRRKMLLNSERRALQTARAVICTSATTARSLIEEYGIAAERVSTARPGSDRIARGPRPAPDGVVHLLSVGTLTRRKGHDLLVEALARLPDLRWSCTIVGSPDRDPAATALVRDAVARHGLGDRIVLTGELPDLSAHYAGADIFVLASLYEGYGMVFAEALQYGLPVIATTGGAIPEVVPSSAGILVPPGDVPALASALRRLIADRAACRDFAAGARKAAAALPRWEDTAGIVAAALQRIGP